MRRRCRGPLFVFYPVMYTTLLVVFSAIHVAASMLYDNNHLPSLTMHAACLNITPWRAFSPQLDTLNSRA